MWPSTIHLEQQAEAIVHVTIICVYTLVDRKKEEATRMGFRKRTKHTNKTEARHVFTSRAAQEALADMYILEVFGLVGVIVVVAKD